MTSLVRTLTAFAFAFALASTGCDKLKGAINKDADGGTTSTGSGLSFLGSDFEGEISMNLTSKTKPTPATQIVFGMKKPKYRLDTVATGQPGQAPAAGTLIIDLPTKKGYALSHPQKTAMVIDFEKMKKMKGQIPGLPGAPKGTTVPSTPPKIEKTGKKDVVAGYTCELWIVTSEGKKADLCVAEGITWIDVSDLGLSSPEMTLAAVTTEANRFPLRVTSYDAKGAEEMRMEATKIDKKKLDDARFVVPPDYRVIDMSNLMGGAGVPGGMPSNIPSLKPR
jgi:hypothetical protein